MLSISYGHPATGDGKPTAEVQTNQGSSPDRLSGSDGSGQAVRFIWNDFQARPLILDPFWVHFDVFGPNHNFGQVFGRLNFAAGAFFDNAYKCGATSLRSNYFGFSFQCLSVFRIICRSCVNVRYRVAGGASQRLSVLGSVIVRPAEDELVAHW